MSIDIVIIAVYLLAVNIIGILVSRAKNINDYFLGGRTLPWPVACFSLVATETSSLTFISIPGLAYFKGMGFMQVAAGYIIGRTAAAVFLLPKYFDGEILTAYQLLQNRFGINSRRAASAVFHVTRLLADSIRLFVTAIPLAMLASIDYRWAIVLIAVTTLVYTYYGGIKSVAVVDTIQLFVYLFSAAAGILLVSGAVGKPFGELFTALNFGSQQIITTGLESGAGVSGILNSYNIFSGLIGGAFVSFATHGTDQMNVQRLLSCRNLSAARKALVWSGIIVFIQFFLFMLWGLLIKEMYAAREFKIPDEVIPFYIINSVPAGFKGLMLAGIFAAAMSSLSSSINSIASSTVIDIFRIDIKDYTEKKKVFLSRAISFFWMVMIGFAAAMLTDSKSPLVELGLSITSVTFGGMLGLFVTASFISGIRERAALAGFFAGIAGVIVIMLSFKIFWPWFMPIGFFISICTAFITEHAIRRIKQLTD